MHDLALKYHRRWTKFSVPYPKSRQCFNDGITVKSNGRKYLIIVKIANFKNIFPGKKAHIEYCRRNIFYSIKNLLND